jgi:electron transfer flavoprotein-quinone oxidoreductase
MAERFDAVVVGAGPAGSAAALALAREKFSVLLVERGRAAGAKNMFGGRVYAWPLFDLLPEWEKDCPVERFVTKESLVFLSGDASLSIQFESPRASTDRASSFTALRPRFDEWLAKKAEAAGAVLITGIRVDELLREDGRVRGVVAGPDRIQADLVVVAEGAMAPLAKKAGLLPDLKPESVSVGVKETVELPAATIQERFNVGEKEGAAVVYAGDASMGLRGGGFLYTNKASVSLGLVVSAEDLARKKVEVQEVMERFRLHPSVQRLIKGGKVSEYSAHLVPELGLGMKARYVGDGVLLAGDAAGFLINNGYTFRGVDLAIASGIAAARAAVDARARGDFSAAGLASYERHLRALNVLTDLETFRATGGYLKNERLFALYPKLLLGITEKVYTVDGSGKERISEIVLKEMKGKAPLVKMLKDLLDGARSM